MLGRQPPPDRQAGRRLDVPRLDRLHAVPAGMDRPSPVADDALYAIRAFASHRRGITGERKMMAVGTRLRTEESRRSAGERRVAAPERRIAERRIATQRRVAAERRTARGLGRRVAPERRVAAERRASVQRRVTSDRRMAVVAE